MEVLFGDRVMGERMQVVIELLNIRKVIGLEVEEERTLEKAG